MELVDRNVVVTGAGSGIGRALARRFADERPRALIVADLNLDAAQATAEEVGATAVRVDVSREAEIVALVERARELGGPIDVFFSNAGVPGPGGGPDGSNDEWQRTWEINVMAHVWAARAVLPEMVERGDGYLLSTASAAGLLTQVSALAYSATKHAAVSVAEWLAINYGDAGVKVSCLCPQGVRTPMLDLALDQDPIGSVALVTEGLLDPDEVAEVVVAAMREERFLILPHPQVADHMALKATQPARWIGGMRKLLRRARAGDAG
jgi:NAD(P)-dependent dehydrogenase (short-subunit alcohol dehydrogenase family)